MVDYETYYIIILCLFVDHVQKIPSRSKSNPNARFKSCNDAFRNSSDSCQIILESETYIKEPTVNHNNYDSSSNNSDEEINVDGTDSDGEINVDSNETDSDETGSDKEINVDKVDEDDHHGTVPTEKSQKKSEHSKINCQIVKKVTLL